MGTTNSQHDSLILPWGFRLVNLLVLSEAHDELKVYANSLPSI